ncbi:MAG: hypothetical protein KGI79_01575 [Patescibacteria group bacterium]|nr:hypothetical protein [Patescibacteria group bacterium]MDE2116546.1 hypothetical protein [Patescibacteria group bacterium]
MNVLTPTQGVRGSKTLKPPFHVSLKPRTGETLAYADRPSFYQKAVYEAFSRFIGAYNHITETGRLIVRLSHGPGGVTIPLVVELPPSRAEKLLHLPVAYPSVNHRATFAGASPSFIGEHLEGLSLTVHRLDEGPELIFEDELVLRPDGFFLKSALERRV